MEKAGALVTDPPQAIEEEEKKEGDDEEEKDKPAPAEQEHPAADSNDKNINARE